MLVKMPPPAQQTLGAEQNSRHWGGRKTIGYSGTLLLFPCNRHHAARHRQTLYAHSRKFSASLFPECLSGIFFVLKRSIRDRIYDASDEGSSVGSHALKDWTMIYAFRTHVRKNTKQLCPPGRKKPQIAFHGQAEKRKPVSLTRSCFRD